MNPLFGVALLVILAIFTPNVNAFTIDSIDVDGRAFTPAYTSAPLSIHMTATDVAFDASTSSVGLLCDSTSITCANVMLVSAGYIKCDLPDTIMPSDCSILVTNAAGDVVQATGKLFVGNRIVISDFIAPIANYSFDTPIAKISLLDNRMESKIVVKTAIRPTCTTTGTCPAVQTAIREGSSVVYLGTQNGSISIMVNPSIEREAPTFVVSIDMDASDTSALAQFRASDLSEQATSFVVRLWMTRSPGDLFSVVAGSTVLMNLTTIHDSTVQYRSYAAVPWTATVGINCFSYFDYIKNVPAHVKTGGYVNVTAYIPKTFNLVTNSLDNGKMIQCRIGTFSREFIDVEPFYIYVISDAKDVNLNGTCGGAVGFKIQSGSDNNTFLSTVGSSMNECTLNFSLGINAKMQYAVGANSLLSIKLSSGSSSSNNGTLSLSNLVSGENKFDLAITSESGAVRNVKVLITRESTSSSSSTGVGRSSSSSSSSSSTGTVKTPPRKGKNNEDLPYLESSSMLSYVPMIGTKLMLLVMLYFAIA